MGHIISVVFITNARTCNAAITYHVKALYVRENMANQKRQRKSRLIAKKALAYLLSRLRTIDATIMRASVPRRWTSISPCGEGRPGTIVKVQIALTCFYHCVL